MQLATAEMAGKAVVLKVDTEKHPKLANATVFAASRTLRFSQVVAC